MNKIPTPLEAFSKNVLEADKKNFPAEKPEVSYNTGVPAIKPKFIRHEHLTQRAISHDEAEVLRAYAKVQKTFDDKNKKRN